MSISNQNIAYRRGVILGLTLAEIMLLVIFLLLLTFMAILKNERERYEHKLLLVKKSPPIEKIIQILEKQAPDIMDELVLANQKLPEIIAMIKKEKLKIRKSETIPDVILRSVENLKADKEIIKHSGSVNQKLKQVINAQEGLIKKQEELIKVRKELETEVENLKGQNKSLYKQIESNGKGVDYPPCWADPTGKQEYIYNIFLTDDGIVIHDNKIPHRAAEQARLPISMIRYDNVLSNSNFQNQTYQLFSWSMANDCRFFVRVYDKTNSNQKKLYKRLLKVVEGRFYKLLI